MTAGRIALIALGVTLLGWIILILGGGVHDEVILNWPENPDD